VPLSHAKSPDSGDWPCKHFGKTCATQSACSRRIADSPPSRADARIGHRRKRPFVFSVLMPDHPPAARAGRRKPLRLQCNLSSQSYPTISICRDRNRSFDGLAAYDGRQVGAGHRRKNTTRLTLASGNYSRRLRLQPHLAVSSAPPMSMARTAAPYIVLTYAIGTRISG